LLKYLGIRRLLKSNVAYFFLIFTPIAIIADHIFHVYSTVVFTVAVLALIPLAKLVQLPWVK
jgi:hypothetical protein